MADIINIHSLIDENQSLQSLTDFIQSVMDFDEAALTNELQESILGMINGAITPTIKHQSINDIVHSFEVQNYTRAQAEEDIKAIKQAFMDFIDDLKPSEKKKGLLDQVFNILFEIFDEALEFYHNADINLPIKFNSEKAQMPTYAYNTDAAADLYTIEDMTLAAHSLSNKINTGINIALPEGWMAMIFPRSSIGAKTGLRLSNSVGIIDSSYRGPICVLYDNISDSDYTIKAGDRIAQMMVLPSYHFKPNKVDELEETERNEGGFGSSGK